MPSEESAYLDLLRRGRTGSDEAYQFKFGLQYERMLEEIMQEAKHSEAAEAVNVVVPKPAFWRIAIPYAVAFLALLFTAIWSVKVAFASHGLASEQEAFEKECEDRLAAINAAGADIMSYFTQASTTGQLETASNIFRVIEKIHEHGISEANTVAVDALKRELLWGSVDMLYGPRMSAHLRVRLDEEIADFAQAETAGEDLFKAALERVKDIACAMHTVTTWSLSPDPHLISMLLAEAEAECEWLMVQPVFAGPVSEPCSTAGSKTGAMPLGELTYGSCESACEALEEYCDGQISASRCALIELEGIMADIGEMVGAK